MAIFTIGTTNWRLLMAEILQWLLKQLLKTCFVKPAIFSNCMHIDKENTDTLRFLTTQLVVKNKQSLLLSQWKQLFIDNKSASMINCFIFELKYKVCVLLIKVIKISYRLALLHFPNSFLILA